MNVQYVARRVFRGLQFVIGNCQTIKCKQSKAHKTNQEGVNSIENVLQKDGSKLN